MKDKGQVLVAINPLAQEPPPISCRKRQEADAVHKSLQVHSTALQACCAFRHQNNTSIQQRHHNCHECRCSNVRRIKQVLFHPINVQSSVGVSEHPCFTPMRHLKSSKWPWDDRTAALWCAYKDLMMCKILPVTPSLRQHSIWYSIKCFVVVNITEKQLANFTFHSCLPLFVNQ